MPELKNAFIKGRMNKDLDERLVPNGEYRDAVNVEVTTSEGGEVGSSGNIGTIRNILGHEEISSGSIVIPADAKTVGSFVDNQNNKIYWLVASNAKDFILEYDETNISVVICDTRGNASHLRFSKNKKITGINLIGGMLLWTDGTNEPKSINIKEFKEASATNSAATLGATTQLNGSNFNEQHITVIKKGPISAPLIDIKETAREGRVTNFTINKDLSNKSIDDVLTNFIIYPKAAGLIVGDVLKIEAEEELPSQGVIAEHVLTAQITAIYHPSSYSTNLTIKIITRSNDIPSSTLTWAVNLVQEEPFYKLKFPRFAYRWKYKHGQYSTISPFSEIAFLPGSYDFDHKKGFNTGMENTARKLEINTFEQPPYGVIEMDILYKDSVSTNVYKVETLKKEEFESIDWNTYKFNIDSEIVSSVIESNQMLRPYDNVPRSALAQEITGNRVVYGNYKQNYTVPKNPIIDCNFGTRSGNTKKTLKSDREYQIGLVWKDYYGRETPVLSSKNSIIKVPKSEARNTNQFNLKVDSSTKPSWATHYKYFIKETSQQYYNLAASRFYEDKEGFYWIAFNSAERNKIQEDDYLIFKKSEDSNITPGDNDKFKVLDISNEYPKFLEDKITVLLIQNNIIFDTFYGSGANVTAKYNFRDGTSSSRKGMQVRVKDITPAEGGDRVLISRHNKDQGYKGGSNKTDSYYYFTQAAAGEEIYIRFGVAGQAEMTNAYKIKASNRHILNDDPGEIEVIFEEPFGSDTDCLYEKERDFNWINGDDSQYLILKPNIFIQFVKKEPSDVDTNEFLGKFFVKIQKESALSNLVNRATNEDNYEFVTTVPFDGDDTNKKQRAWHIRFGGRKGPPEVAVNGKSHTNGYAFGPNSVDSPNSEDPNNAEDSPIFHLSLETVNVGPDYDAAIAESYLYDQMWNELEAGYYLQFDNFDPYNRSGQSSKTKWTATMRRKYYKVKSVAKYQNNKSGHEWARIHIELEENLEADLQYKGESAEKPSGYNDGSKAASQAGFKTYTWMKIWKPHTDFATNPAVFETEPKEAVELNIFYETQETWSASSDINNVNSLKWFNAFSFKNGVESNRIRDDFNAPIIDKGPRVSTTLDTPYEEEDRSSGLIYSGIFNSTSGVNNLNQFIAAEKITKDLNPTFGSIQKLYSKETNLIAFCEDKVITILANKDALFNADGNPNLISTNRVLGNATPFVGDFGISKNPESFAAYGFRIYFSDKSRGAIMRLSRDGLTPISNAGMKGYFKTNLSKATEVLGYYNAQKDSYEIALNNDVVEFKESVAGWPSRKNYDSKIPEGGVSLNNRFYLFYSGKLWEHSNQERNKFFGASSPVKSSVKFVYNQESSKIKNFKTLNYEGATGWSCPSIITDQQDGKVPTFIKEEGKYYNFIKGVANTWDPTSQTGKLDTSEFSTQGIDTLGSISGATDQTEFTLTIVENND